MKTEIDIRRIAGQVVKHLPNYFLAPKIEGENDSSVYLVEGKPFFVRGESKGLFVHNSWPRGRISISCLWPGAGRMQHSPGESKSITVSKERPPEAIAKDIQRRLLTWYDPKWVEMCQRHFAHNVEDIQQDLISAKFLEILGSAAYSTNDGMRLHCGDVEIEIHSSEKATLKCSYANPDIVEKVLRSLAEQGCFVPVCSDPDCLKPAKHFVQKRWGKKWYCDECLAAEIEADKEWEQLQETSSADK